MSTRGTRAHTQTNDPGPPSQPGAGGDTAAPQQPAPTDTNPQPRPDTQSTKYPSPTLPGIQARSANENDVDEICRLVNAWADEGLTLRRYQDEVRECIGEFVVVEWAPTTDDDPSTPPDSPDPAAKPVEPTRAGLIACGALAVFSPNLGEIRSVAVDTAAKGTGAGRHVVQFMLDQAILLELDAVVLLTRIPAFFAKFGFHEVGTEEVPSAFIEEAIAGRGRTIEGRIIMLRNML